MRRFAEYNYVVHLNTTKYENRVMEKVKEGIFLITLIAGSLYFSGYSTANLVNGQTDAPVYTPQEGKIGTSVTLSNSLVNANTLYDLIIRTVKTGLVKTVEVTFPPGTKIADLMLMEVSGIGPGLTSITGQKLIYSVSTPLTVTSGSAIRLEVGNIISPPVPNPSLKVSVITKTEFGVVIDSMESLGYAVRQIAQNDLADNSITTNKILDGQVSTLDLANNAVTTAKLADNSVTTPKIAPGAITSDKLSPNALHIQITEKINKVAIPGGDARCSTSVL